MKKKKKTPTLHARVSPPNKKKSPTLHARVSPSKKKKCPTLHAHARGSPPKKTPTLHASRENMKSVDKDPTLKAAPRQTNLLAQRRTAKPLRRTCLISDHSFWILKPIILSTKSLTQITFPEKIIRTKCY
jgi:hypothetical protein